MTTPSYKSSVYLIIPVFNEQGRIEAVIRESLKYLPATRIVIVDDGSKYPLKPTRGVTVLRHILNLGKGAALKTGIEYAILWGGRRFILMDGDGQHQPREINRFIKLLDDGNDVVFGSRRPSLRTPLIRLLGNKFASIYVNLIFGVYISDILSGFRAINLRAYRLLYWSSLRYGVETEIVARLGKYRQSLKFSEFPIKTIYTDKYKGVTILDALHILGQSIWWKLS